MRQNNVTCVATAAKLTTGVIMSDLVRCHTCEGHKKVYGLGMLDHTCGECQGVGYMRYSIAVVIPARLHERDEPSEIQLKSDDFEHIIKKASVKRGRPKKFAC